MPNITWCDLPEDVSLWPGLPLSLSGDEVMPLDYHAGRSGWLLYGRGLDKQRLTQYQSKLGAAMVIVAAWCVEDYQVIRLAGSLTARATRLAHEAQLDVAKVQEKIEVATYEKAIQTAFKEVSDGLVAQEGYRDQLQAQQALVDTIGSRCLRSGFQFHPRRGYRILFQILYH